MFEEVKVASPAEEVEVVRTGCCVDDWTVAESNEDEVVEESDTGTPISRVGVPEVLHDLESGPVPQAEGVGVVAVIAFQEG